MRRIGMILALLTILIAGAAVPHEVGLAAQHQQASLATKSVRVQVNTYLTRLAKQQLFMGSILIARKGAVLLNRGYGFSNWERHVPNTRGTRFLLASVTKQFTAMAILQLQEQGKLTVQDRACTYIARCPAAWKDVTIHQLLSHTSGIKDLFRDLVGFDDSKYWTPDQIITLIKDEPLNFQPGTDWHYSNIAYIALGLIIENVSGKPYGTFLQDHIFQPLGMTHTGLSGEGVTVPHLARGYDGHNRVEASRLHAATFFAAGGLYSTVGDLYLWDQALATEKLVPKTSLEAMFSPSFTFTDASDDGVKWSYGYGWNLGSTSGHRIIVHDGGLPGVATINAVFPDDGVTVVILTNNERTAMSVIFPYITGAIFRAKTVSLAHIQREVSVS